LHVVLPAINELLPLIVDVVQANELAAKAGDR